MHSQEPSQDPEASVGPPPALQADRPGPRSPTLTEIARRLKAEKARKPEPITDVYDRYLWPWRGEPITLLEIGIKRGSSLHLWHEYFPRARIFALDIRDCSAKVPASERIETFVGDQADEEFLGRVIAASGPLDLVIDDGSHYPADQRASLLALWPHLRPGGLYAIEDLATSYRHRGTSYRQPGSTMEMLKDVVDDVHELQHSAEPTLGSVAAVHVERHVALLRRAAGPELIVAPRPMVE